MTKITRKQSRLIAVWLACIIIMLTISGFVFILSMKIMDLQKDIILLSIDTPAKVEPVVEVVKEEPKLVPRDTEKEVKLATRSASNRNVYKFISKYNKTQATAILDSMENAYKEFKLESYGMSFECFVAQAHVESKFNPKELGKDSDIGLYQIIPATARDINKSYFKIPGFRHDMLYDIDLNCRFGAYYLSYIFKRGYSVGDTLEVYNKWLKGLKYTDYRNKVFSVEERIV